MIELRLPLPPSVNRLYRAVAGRGVIKSERYRTWIQGAGVALRQQHPKSVKGDYVLWLYCERPDKRRRDLANLVKALEDLLVAHGVVEDDSLCAEVHVYWQGDGRECTVKIEPAIPARASIKKAA